MCMTYVSFPCPPLETALAMFNLRLKKTVFGKALIKAKQIANNANHKLSKNVCLEKIHSVVG
jgi:hypothetical protein